MDRSTKRDAAESTGYDVRGVTVHHGINAWESLKELAMYIALDEAVWSVRVKWCGIGDLVFDDITSVCNQSRGKITGHEEVGSIVGVSHTHVAVGV